MTTAMLAPEVASIWLNAFPGSSFAWYLNLELLSALREARLQDSPVQFLFGSESVVCGGCASAAILLCRMARFRLGLALLSNLAFGVTLILGWRWIISGVSAQSGPIDMAAWSMLDSGGLVLAALVTASFVACGSSHASFAASILCEASGRRPRQIGAV